MKVDVYKSNTRSWTYLIVPEGKDPQSINPAPVDLEFVHPKWMNYETENTILETEYFQSQMANPGYFVFR